MGCRPSRNALGRVADSTSEYNRCYIKELDKARRKQKKNTRGGRRRTPTYNAFSSTTKCYERDKGASKITVRLSTDGSMLEIEQYDIDYSPADDFISEDSSEDRGIEMKPAGGESLSFERFLNKKLSYGRSDSAPLLKTDGIITVSSGAVEYNGSNSSCYSEDSINCVTPHGEYVSDNSSSIVAVNVHKQISEQVQCPEGDIKETQSVCGKSKTSYSKHLEADELSNDFDRLRVGPEGIYRNALTETPLNIHLSHDFNSFRCRNGEINSHSGSGNKLNHYHQQDTSEPEPIPSENDCEKDKLNCRNDNSDIEENLIKTFHVKCARINAICTENERLGENILSEEEHKPLTELSLKKLVKRNHSCTMETDCLRVNCCSLAGQEMGNQIKVHKDKDGFKYQINKRGKTRELNETHISSDRFHPHCFVCEKDKWNNREPLCAYINNKCHTFVSPGRQDCGTDSNANVCFRRRHASVSEGKKSHAVNVEVTNKNRARDKRKAFYHEDKMSFTDQTVKHNSRPSFHYEANRNYPRQETNRITTDIDLSEQKLVHALLGQQTVTPNKPVALFSDNAQCVQSSEKSMRADTLNEHLDELCRENMKNYKCVCCTCCAREETEIKIDKFKTVTMVTNDVSETTLRNDEQLRSYHHVSTMEDSDFSRNGGKYSSSNDFIDNVEDEIYHDAFSCQRGTYANTTSQCYRHSDPQTGGSNFTSRNNEKNQSICNTGNFDDVGIIRGDIWRYKHIDMNNYDDDNDGYNIDDSDTSDDYRDEEYVDAMETTYV